MSMINPASQPAARAALAVEIDDIHAAAKRLDGVSRITPVLNDAALDARLQARVHFKCENLQIGGAFKFRGAFNALVQLDAAQAKRGVVAYSSGNHALAVALAARHLQMPACIVMPHDAPELKRDATRAAGASIIEYDRYHEDRESIAQRIAQCDGLALIPPFDHPQVIAGQGTVATELIEQVGPLDLLLVCVGGGGLISGCATASRALQPQCRVVGVEPAAGDDVRRSLAAGKIVQIEVPKTIADGAQTRSPGELTFPIMRARVDAIELASDAELRAGMRYFADHLKLVVEPTGCLAAAPLLSDRLDVRGLRVGVVISGGNVGTTSFLEHLAMAMMDRAH